MSTSSPLSLSHRAMDCLRFVRTEGKVPLHAHDDNDAFRMPLTVASLHLYPVKGLKAIDVRAARCTDRGLEHDRRWMVVDAQGRFLSQREQPRMATIWTDLDNGSLLLSAPDVSTVEVPVDPAPSAPTLHVRVWSSECEALAPSRQADAWLSDYLG